ncbi:hypothetical protein AX14_004783 [Amanita brunnescens Koide BX004]|nr:hypothetical protein AX14_004783 [Amanita brunnescens Koide BX004]
MSESLHSYIYIYEPVSYFVGNVINLFLYGALTVQLYTYYISFSKDRWSLKTIVYLIYMIETTYTILLTYSLGQLLHAVTLPILFLILIPTCGGIVAFLTQAMYAYRIRTLGKLKCIPWCIMAMIISELIIIVAVIILLPSGLGILAWASISLVIDVMVAGAMIWSLRKSTILSKRLKSKVTRLIHLVIGTGALTAVVNLLTVILLLKKATTALGPAIVLSKLYANSMMVFLNDRIPSSHDHDGHATSNVATLGGCDVRGTSVWFRLGSVYWRICLLKTDDASQAPHFLFTKSVRCHLTYPSGMDHGISSQSWVTSYNDVLSYTRKKTAEISAGRNVMESTTTNDSRSTTRESAI